MIFFFFRLLLSHHSLVCVFYTLSTYSIVNIIYLPTMLT